jgi:acyl carrier protein
MIPMTDEEIYARLTPIFRDVFDDDSVAPHATMTAAEVPAWDSLSNIRLVVAVEQEFKIQFSTGEVAGLKNVGEFVSVIRQRAAG